MSEHAAPIVHVERVPAGCHTSLVLRRGYALRLTDLAGGANASTLFFNREDPSERYSMPDTLKAQHTAYLTAGCVGYSDMGRVLVSIIGDSLGWHDTVCGVADAALIAARYGASSYQQARNGYHRNGRDGLLMQLGRHGLGERDLVANVNFFSKVVVDLDGGLHHVAGHSPPGAWVELRAEMNVLIVLSAAPHPLRAAGVYPQGEVELTVRRDGLAGPDDACRRRCPENERGFALTEAYFAQTPLDGDHR